MSLKYWDDMSGRERSGKITAGPVFAGALRQFDLKMRFPEEDKCTDGESTVAVFGTADGTSGNTSSAMGTGQTNGSDTGKDATLGQISSSDNKNVTAGQNISNENHDVEQENTHSKLPRPLALIFGTLLIVVSTVGISVLTAVVFLVAAVLALISAGLIGGGIFAIFEGITNISTASVIAIECMGIGLAAIALGIIVFVLASKCGFELLPKTTGLYPKSIRTATNL
ncbi:MAG: hypothetical protein J6Y89_02090 [Lachnospiraceae bacterium]|nr:hypothetical protein [Lachnospiraceae bacterium]